MIRLRIGTDEKKDELEQPVQKQIHVNKQNICTTKLFIVELKKDSDYITLIYLYQFVSGYIYQVKANYIPIIIHVTFLEVTSVK